MCELARWRKMVTATKSGLSRRGDGSLASKGNIYDQCVARMKSASPQGFRAVLWQQGDRLGGSLVRGAGQLHDRNGLGVHFSGAGLRKRVARWAAKVIPWIEKPWIERQHTQPRQLTTANEPAVREQPAAPASEKPASVAATTSAERCMGVRIPPP